MTAELTDPLDCGRGDPASTAGWTRAATVPSKTLATEASGGRSPVPQDRSGFKPGCCRAARRGPALERDDHLAWSAHLAPSCVRTRSQRSPMPCLGVKGLTGPAPDETYPSLGGSADRGSAGPARHSRHGGRQSAHGSFRDVRRAGAAPSPTTRRCLRRAVTATTRSKSTSRHGAAACQHNLHRRRPVRRPSGDLRPSRGDRRDQQQTGGVTSIELTPIDEFTDT